MKKFYLIGKNIPSSKNNKQWTGKILINNKLTQKFYEWGTPILNDMKSDILNELQEKEQPYHFHYYFFRDSKRKWDFNNISQSISDLLVKCGIIQDDNTAVYIPVYDGEEVVSKEKAGVSFWIE